MAAKGAASSSKSSESEETFIATWEIRNFSFCFHKSKESFHSPEFRTPFTDGTLWKITFYPRGNKCDKHFACFLAKSDKTSRAVGIKFRLSVIAADGLHFHLQATDNIFNDEKIDWGFHNFIARSTIFQNRRRYLPRDTFTIQCQFWRSNESPAEKMSTSDDDNIYNMIMEKPASLMNSDFSMLQSTCLRSLHHYQTSCRAVTEMKVETISSGFVVKLNEQNAIPVVISGTTTNFLLKMVLEPAGKKYVIALDVLKLGRRPIYVACKLYMSDLTRSAQHTEEIEHYFQDDNENWMIKMEPEIPQQILQQALDFKIDFKISEGTQSSYMEKLTSDTHDSDLNASLNSDSQSFHEDISALYANQMDCDFTLVCNDRKKLRAHRNILSARSPVFRNMFKHNTKEKRENRVDVSDVDRDTLHLLLQYMYNSSHLPDLETDKAMKLYTAADKYQVLRLKEHCSNILKSKMCISRVVDILIMADQRNDANLRSAAISFVRQHASVVLSSHAWRSFVKTFEHAELVCDVLMEVSLHNAK